MSQKPRTKPGSKPTAEAKKDLERFCRKESSHRRAKPAIPPQNGLKHGVYANHFLNEKERGLFRRTIATYEDDFQFNKSSDFIQVELIGLYTLKINRALDEKDNDNVERFDRMLRAHLKDLKATKSAREGTEPTRPHTTPAEWAADLIAQAEKEEREAAARSNTEKTQKEGQITPASEETE